LLNSSFLKEISFSFSLPQPFYDADFSDLPVQKCRYRRSQEDQERIDHQHGPYDKAIGEEPNPAGNTLHD